MWDVLLQHSPALTGGVSLWLTALADGTGVLPDSLRRWIVDLIKSKMHWSWRFLDLLEGLLFMLLGPDCHLAASNCMMPLISEMLKRGRTCILKYPADGSCLCQPLITVECLEACLWEGKTQWVTSSRNLSSLLNSISCLCCDHQTRTGAQSLSWMWPPSWRALCCSTLGVDQPWEPWPTYPWIGGTGLSSSVCNRHCPPRGDYFFFPSSSLYSIPAILSL